MTGSPIFLSFGEAYMDGSADGLGEAASYLTGAAIGAKDDAVRTVLLRAAEYIRSRQRDCDKARWELRDERSTATVHDNRHYERCDRFDAHAAHDWPSPAGPEFQDLRCPGLTQQEVDRSEVK